MHCKLNKQWGHMLKIHKSSTKTQQNKQDNYFEMATAWRFAASGRSQSVVASAFLDSGEGEESIRQSSWHAASSLRYNFF